MIFKKLPYTNDAIAFYTFSNFTITLTDISSENLENIKNNPTCHIEKLSTINHELRHYIDHISTIWGQKYILQHYNAINGKLSLKVEELHNIIKFLKNQDKLFYQDYYTEILEPNFKFRIGASTPWGFELKIIFKFNDEGLDDETRPLYCAVFTKSETDRTRIARIPVSIVSLLEVNAMYHEILLKVHNINNMSEPSKSIENKLFQKWIFEEYIYNPKIIIYNVIVHITAIFLKIPDILLALRIASFISTITLNLTDNQINKIKINQNLNKKSSEFFIKNKDYGFLFINILFNYRDTFLEKQKYDLDDILSCNNLDNKETFKKECISEFESNILQIKSQKHFVDIFSKELNKGMLIFSELDIDFSNDELLEIIAKNNINPNFIFSDTELESFEITKENFHKNLPFDKEINNQMFSELLDVLHHEFTTFYKACGL